MVVPALMCSVRFACAGGTAIDPEHNGGAGGVIFAAANGDEISAITDFMLATISGVLSWCMTFVIVILLMTFPVTSASSAVLIVDTINAAGDEGPKPRPHIIFRGVAPGAVVARLPISGGTCAIRTAMVIGALPFSVMMVLTWIALLEAIWNDGRRALAGVSSTFDEIPGDTPPRAPNAPGLQPGARPLPSDPTEAAPAAPPS